MRSMKLGVPKAPGQKRHNAQCGFGIRGMWCGLVGWEQLAWLTAKIAPLQWHVEVDFPAEVQLVPG